MHSNENHFKFSFVTLKNSFRHIISYHNPSSTSSQPATASAAEPLCEYMSGKDFKILQMMMTEEMSEAHITARGRFILVKFKSIKPFYLRGIRHNMYALVLL